MLLAERARGRSGAAAALMIAAWMDFSAVGGGRSTTRWPRRWPQPTALSRRRSATLLRCSPELVIRPLAGGGPVVELIESLRGTFSGPAVPE